MPIKVTCQCGQSFNAKDELAGKAVKCPKCQQPLRIPAASASASAPAKSAQKGAAKSPAAASDPFGGGSLFDEVGLKQHAAGTMPCPGCGKPLAQNVIVCIECGYNMKLGRRMTTAKTGGGGDDHGGHGGVAASLMERAAQTLEEDKDAEQATTKEGLPWWVYLILLAALGGFMGTMIVIANRQKPKEEKKGLLAPVSEMRLVLDSSHYSRKDGSQRQEFTKVSEYLAHT